MKILLINGSPHQHGVIDLALTEMEKVFASLGVETERIWIGNGPTHGCIACGHCRTTGQGCVFNDVANTIANKMNEVDGMVVGSPVYYAGPNGTLQAILDRAFYQRAKGKMTVLAGCSVVSCRRGGASATFDRLNKYFTISEIPVVSSSYWNSIHGNSQEEALQDLEGLKTLRVLAKNMYYLIDSLQNSKTQKPEEEPPVSTNFIR